jgi:transglutaminase-like putative cysteine protease
MKIDIDVSLTYELGSAKLALLALEVAETEDQIVTADDLHVQDALLQRIEGETGFGTRTWARVDGAKLRVDYKASVDVRRQPAQFECLSATPLDELRGELITFVRPSRYCQSDQFESFVAQEFGHISGGEKIAAMVEWIQSELTYNSGTSNTGTTLKETFSSRQGVCRDFAHMLSGLARAAYIPARYVSAYGPSVNPQDFHAVVQVWLNNQWHLIDPTGMCTPDELVLIGVGRDAADVPFLETPDEARLLEQKVRVTSV